MLLRLFSDLLFFATVWILWPRELDGHALSRDGRISVPDYAMAGAHYMSVKKGKLEVENFSRNASFDINSQRMIAEEVVSLIYDARDERTIVAADRASLEMEKRLLHLSGNVRALSPDGFLLQGPVADYDLKQRLLTAPQPVEGESFLRELRVWGDRAEAPVDENRVSLLGNARALYHEPRRGPTHIRGDSAVLERKEEKARFLKNVKVLQDKVVASSEEADLYYSRLEKGVRYMSMNGDVRITQNDGKYSRSQLAEFFSPTDTIVLSGFPAVYDGNDAVTGDKITVYRTTGVVEVLATNAAGKPEAGGAARGQGGEPALAPEDEELIP